MERSQVAEGAGLQERDQQILAEKMAARRVTRVAITEIPRDLELGILPEHLRGGTPAERITVPGRMDILTLKSATGRGTVACFFFGGRMTTHHFFETDAEANQYIERKLLANIDHLEAAERGENDLQAFMREMNASSQMIESFPQDLRDNPQPGVRNYIGPNYFRAENVRKVLRIEFGHGVVALVLYPVDRDSYFVSLYKDGDHQVGNHDWSIGEFKGAVRALIGPSS